MQVTNSLDYTYEQGRDIGKDVQIIALSTCGFCKRALRFLRENNIAFRFIYFDDLDRDVKSQVREEVREKFDIGLAFPYLIIDGKEAHSGFNEEKWRAYLELDKTEKEPAHKAEGEEPDELDTEYKFVENTAHYKGWELVANEQFLRDLVEGLHKNRERYGYYLCPCREGTGDRKADTDIVCPCDHAAPDIQEYGHCYCALYQSPEFKKSGKTPSSIPERRNERK